jgi:flagellar export protein FliJ
MTAFKFRLARVLNLKETQLKTEEFKLEALLRERARMQADIEAVELTLQNERHRMEAATYSSSAQWLAFEHFKRRAEKDLQEAARKLAAQDAVIEKQRAVIVEARRGVLLLEKLREKRRADWQLAADKEMEELTADFSAAQWLRQASTDK